VRDKSKWSDAYTPIELRDIERAGLPPPPEKDAYLRSRLDKFVMEVSKKGKSQGCWGRGKGR
jgi:hypothetical protein